MSDLATMVPSLKREVAPPGQFETLFPTSNDATLEGTLKDGFWSARLDGWFPAVTIDDNGISTPDLSGQALQLVVLYGARQILQGQLRNLPTTQRYKAGTLEVDTQYAATVLKSALDEIATRVKDLLQFARYGSGTTVLLHDAYIARGLYENEWVNYSASTELPY